MAPNWSGFERGHLTSSQRGDVVVRTQPRCTRLHPPHGNRVRLVFRQFPVTTRRDYACSAAILVNGRPLAAKWDGVVVRLRVTPSVQRSGDGVIPLPSHEKLFGRKFGDHLAAVSSDDHFFFDACCTPSVTSGPVGFQ